MTNPATTTQADPQAQQWQPPPSSEDGVELKADLGGYYAKMLNKHYVRTQGKVVRMVGQVIEAYNPGCAAGSLCTVYNPSTGKRRQGEVIGFEGDKILLMTLEQMPEIGPQCRVIPGEGQPMAQVGNTLLGRVVDGLGRPLDGLGLPNLARMRSLYADPVNPMERRRISQPLDVGVRAINGLLSCGRGQRVGIIAGSGVGKSVLLGMMARHTTADVNVIALIGERGREVIDFIEENLGKEGLKRSVVVAATSDQPPLVRRRAAFLASAYAEHFRDQGADVLLLMDSVTRFSMSQREIGLAAGEPPTTRGYPPSVFSLMPRLLERAGLTKQGGSITGFYTVLVEGDDPNDPIGDAVRSIVDGHVVLDRSVASKGRFPAIDVLTSASRVMKDVTSTEHQQRALAFKRVLSIYQEAEDLINIGAYVKGANPAIDYALSKMDAMSRYLHQSPQENASFHQSLASLHHLLADMPNNA